ncbi:AraC family ligand binding domain-containing protein, partial [Kibdelosporangium lantanae]
MEEAVWTRVDAGHGVPLDLLTARFVHHRFAPHAHEEFSIGACVEGVEVIDYRGARHYTGPGSLVVIEPGEVHTGGAARPGGFAYSYPFATPPSINGAKPALSMGYMSGMVDGLTSGTNNQASWVGDGWDFTAGGYVERHFQSCSEDIGGNNPAPGTGDNCYAVENATLVLGGKSTELVKDKDSGKWVPKDDDGAKVEILTGAANNAWNGEYWKVTAQDGTQYFLGLNRLPGWSSGKPETQSVWTVPVFSNNPPEPCYHEKFIDSHCDMAWRWNLDYTVDPNNNVTTYYYQPETNYYGMNLNRQTAGTKYTAGGYPLRIEYGLHLDKVGPAGQQVDSVYATDPA